MVARLTRELNDQSRQLDRLQSDERDLQTLITGIEEALNDIPVEQPQQVAFAGLRGRLPWPARAYRQPLRRTRASEAWFGTVL